MFKRRTKRTWPAAVGRWIYPRGGWTRAARYVSHRLRRLPDPADKIARGIAAGVFISFTPFFGAHFLFSAGLAWAIRGNIVASLLATFFGNPITFPIIAATSVELGSWLLGQPPVPLPRIVASFSYASLELWSNLGAVLSGAETDWSRLDIFFRQVFWPYLVGGIGPGLAAALVAYGAARPLISAYQRRRIKRQEKRLGLTRRPAKPAADSMFNAE
ncbi:DUF2062 domain-containing protein [Roseitranquillus sediminis]|uniref:DUF2062 domain-containing protein n=1 Tax=Roseitranquillus sediminis TaxID=2809051 RepID=UPI001D0CC03F|nr:DUF2062 domain-containing protein [Roseitranquillus sediminis]MBM9596287.1 DUF2062 domain-containing protein [Roseitranquillus sediminis]